MTFRQEPHLSGFFPLAERRNSEWHVSGLLPLRSRLSAGPGHPAVIQDSAIGLGTTQNTRRLRSRMSGGFWPTLLAGLPFPAGTLRDQRIPSGSAEVRARLVSDRKRPAGPSQSDSSLPGEVESGRNVKSENSAGAASAGAGNVSAGAASAGRRIRFGRSCFGRSR